LAGKVPAEEASVLVPVDLQHVARGRDIAAAVAADGGLDGLLQTVRQAVVADDVIGDQPGLKVGQVPEASIRLDQADEAQVPISGMENVQV
jgi:hypothetical protein